MLYLRYLGPQHSGREWHHVYVISDEIDVARTGPVNFRTAKRIRGVSAGHLYQAEGPLTDELTWQPPTLRWHSALPQRDAEQLAAESAAKLQDAERTALREDWRTALDGVRAAYSQARGAQRNQLLAQVVAYITGGK